MIFALIAIVVVALVVWAAASVAVNSGDQVQSIGAGGVGDAPSFPSPSDVWGTLSLSGSGMADSAKGAWGSASASAAKTGLESAWGPTAGALTTPTPPAGAAGAPAAAQPKGGIFSFIPGWNQATGTNVNTSVTSIPGVPNIVEGQSYKCSNLNPWAIYRGYNGTLRMYPNPTVAGSWDIHWGNPITIDCSKVEMGTQMEMNPDPKLIEGHSYTCEEGGVYRAMDGILRWYPNPAIAVSWDPAWASPVKIDCSGVKKGAPMQMAPSPALAEGGSSTPAPVKADTSALEKRMKEVVDDLDSLNSRGFFHVGNAKIDEDEYKGLRDKLSAAGVSWTRPKFESRIN